MGSLRDSLFRMLADTLPGAQLLGTRRLRGGLAAQTHAARIELADGSRRTLVVRRKANGALRIPRHYRTLEVLAETAVPAPKPFLLDVSNRYFDVPTMVIEHAGYPLLKPRDQAAWLRELAEGIHRTHQLNPRNADLTHLAAPLPSNPSDPPGEAAADALVEEVREVLGRTTVDPFPPCLIHDDYWPGNTVWDRGQRLSAIIDWDGATIGDPRVDIAQCRIDLTFIAGEDAADAFLQEYESLHGGPLHDLWYFELTLYQQQHNWFESWHAGYADIGIDWTTPRKMIAAGRQFATRALKARQS